MLKISNLAAGYTKENMILKRIDLEVNKGEVVAIVGQNGCGKSTLAKAIMNLVPYSSGAIALDSRSIYAEKTHVISSYGIGYFMQGGRLFQHLSVEENLAFAGAVSKRKGRLENYAVVQKHFEFLEKPDILKAQASNLSGGEQHMLALAMVMMNRPKFLVLDEPSAGLSPANVKKLYNALYRIKESEVQSILIIEQNVNFAVEFSNRIVLLQQGYITKTENSKNINSSKKIDEFFFDNINKTGVI